MKLYLLPFACSLACHIALREAGIDFEPVKVDVRSKKTADGGDFLQINSKGYVPTLQLDNGETFTEAGAILQYIADLKPQSGLAPAAGTVERYRLTEWLSFISTEIHKNFSPLFAPHATEPHKQFAKDMLAKRFDWLQNALAGRDYLLGNQFTVADAYLFTVLGWASVVGVDLSPWPALQKYHAAIAARPAVAAALQAEGALAAA